MKRNIYQIIPVHRYTRIKFETKPKLAPAQSLNRKAFSWCLWHCTFLFHSHTIDRSRLLLLLFCFHPPNWLNSTQDFSAVNRIIIYVPMCEMIASRIQLCGVKCQNCIAWTDKQLEHFFGCANGIPSWGIRRLITCCQNVYLFCSFWFLFPSEFRNPNH